VAERSITDVVRGDAQTFVAEATVYVRRTTHVLSDADRSRRSGWRRQPATWVLGPTVAKPSV